MGIWPLTKSKTSYKSADGAIATINRGIGPLVWDRIYVKAIASEDCSIEAGKYTLGETLT
jgi:hypothetical protein